MGISPKKFLRERLRRVYKLRFLHKLSLYSVIASHLDNSRYRGYNWWDEYASLFWLPRFIDLYFEPKKKINLFSSFRKPLRFIRHYKGVNIFLSGENLANSEHGNFHPRILDHRIGEVDLALGFEFNDDPKYYRFPLWVYHNEFISPDASLEDIRTLLEQINAPSTRRGAGRSRFIGQISSHDNGGMRGRLIDLLSPIGQIDCAGGIVTIRMSSWRSTRITSSSSSPTIASTSARRIRWAKATSQRRSSTVYAQGVSPSIGVLT